MEGNEILGVCEIKRKKRSIIHLNEGELISCTGIYGKVGTCMFNS